MRTWVGGGGLRIGVVGWLFVLQLAKYFWVWGICVRILGLSFEAFDWLLTEWGDFEIL